MTHCPTVNPKHELGCQHGIKADDQDRYDPGLPTDELPQNLSPRVREAVRKSGLPYPSFVNQLLSCAFASAPMWQEDDVERIFWLAERLGLDPLERELIAIVEDQTPLKPLGFMVTVDGWVKLLHRHPRFRGLAFEEGPTDEHGLPQWASCTIHWEGFACPWVVREWGSEQRSLHELWLKHPRRMLRHKALTQCARLALGIGGGFWSTGSEIDQAVEKQAGDLHKPPFRPTMPGSTAHSEANGKHLMARQGDERGMSCESAAVRAQSSISKASFTSTSALKQTLKALDHQATRQSDPI